MWFSYGMGYVEIKPQYLWQRFYEKTFSDCDKFLTLIADRLFSGRYRNQQSVAGIGCGGRI